MPHESPAQKQWSHKSVWLSLPKLIVVDCNTFLSTLARAKRERESKRQEFSSTLKIWEGSNSIGFKFDKSAWELLRAHERFRPNESESWSEFELLELSFGPAFSCENLVLHQDNILQLMIFYILITSLLDKVLILWGEMRCRSLDLLTSALDCWRRLEHVPQGFVTRVTVGRHVVMHGNEQMPHVVDSILKQLEKR